MARYIYLEHYSADGGKLGLSDKVFSQLAKHSIKTIKEIVRDKNTIVQAAIKNNTVNYKIVVYVEPLSKWNKWIMYQHRDENCLEGVKKIEPTTDENEGRNKIKGKPINEKCFYKIYILIP